METTKHYIRVDDQNRIIKGFSDAFEEPLETDICVNEDGGRHFKLNNAVNPPLTDVEGIYLYKYDNGIVERTPMELEGDRAPQPKSEFEVLRETVDMLVLDSLEG